ncbi:MAG TPA: hypothetical protein VE646_03045 [Actinomycetota bacterium]|jgi:cell division septum initiation protein DivIVA|nr:hypothetical protein [Actinomycetota bacterium]
MATEGSGFGSAASGDRSPPSFDMVKRGFDPDQVLQYLRGVAQRVQALEDQIRGLEREREEAKRERDIALEAWETARKDPYEALAAHVAELVRHFDAEVEKLRGEAELEAARILSGAREEADRIRQQAGGAQAEARGQADHIRRQAREEAERILGDAKAQTDQIKSHLMTLHGSTLNELRIIRDHMRNSVREIDVILNGGQQQEEERVVVLGHAGEAEKPVREDEPSARRQETPFGQ